MSVNHLMARVLGASRPLRMLAIGVAANLLALGVFKYAGLFSEVLLDALGRRQMRRSAPIWPSFLRGRRSGDRFL